MRFKAVRPWEVRWVKRFAIIPRRIWNEYLFLEWFFTEYKYHPNLGWQEICTIPHDHEKAPSDSECRYLFPSVKDAIEVFALVALVILFIIFIFTL